MAELGDRAQVVIVGGGIVGCSIAYHLTRRGVTDVLLIEQGQLTSGTTWHAAGLVSQLKSSHSLTRLATYSAQLFEELEAETGQATGYRAPGSISVAADHERWEELLRGMSMARTVGVDIREDRTRRGPRALPTAQHRRLGGRAVHPPRRDHLAGGHHHGPGQGGPGRRRSHRAGHRGDRSSSGGRPGSWGGHRGGPGGSRDRCVGRGHLDPPVGRHRRGERAGAGLRALLHRDRARRRGLSEYAHGARPVQLHLFQRGDRQAHGRLLRAPGQGLEP